MESAATAESSGADGPESAELPGLLDERNRLVLGLDVLAGDDHFPRLLLLRQVVHQLEHHVFDDHPEAARADLALQRVFRNRLERVVRPRRVLVGRKAYAVAGADGLNWGALANCESGGNPRAVNPAGYYGLYQFDLGTWRSVGGSGLPTAASAGEQTYRAKLLYKQRGRSPWPTCGRLL